MCRIDDLAGCRDRVIEQRLTAYFMQHLGAARFEPGPLAGCHDDYGEFRA
jgi:hypothetical protein